MKYCKHLKYHKRCADRIKLLEDIARIPHAYWIGWDK